MKCSGLNWKKGMFVVNRVVLVEWGVGIVTEDQREGFVRVFFEHPSIVKRVEADKLERVADPGNSRAFLENAMVDEEVAAKYDREPFPTVLKRFLENFPGGFKGDLYREQERDYKIVAVDWASEHLNQAKWLDYLDRQRYEELAQEIRRLYSKLNLLASFEMIKVTAALKDEGAQKSIGESLYELVYGDGNMKARFDQAAMVLERHDIGKWPVITYPLFLLVPNEHIFIKPEMTKAAAATRGFDIQYDSQLNWTTYSQVLSFANDLRERLLASDNPHLHPVDMVDIQGFMWCTFAKAYSRSDHAKIPK